MTERFEEFVSNINRAYKHILKIKAYEMQEFGLKAAHVMTLFFIGKHPEGLTAGELSELCREDKAGISKALAELKKQGYVEADDADGTKKYRSKYKISEKGKSVYQKISEIIIHAVEVCSNGVSETERINFYNTLDVIVLNIEKFSKHLEEKTLNRKMNISQKLKGE